MGLYDGREHPYNPARHIHPFERLTFGIPGKYFGYVFLGLWVYLFWDIAGRTYKNNRINAMWRSMYLNRLDKYYITNLFPNAQFPPFLYPPHPHKLLPAVTEEAIIEHNTPKPPEEKKEGEKKGHF